MSMSLPRPAALPLLLLLLSVTTGLVDATSVLGLGKVFTANMTGNVVFLGFAVAGMPGFHAMAFIVAIAAFMAGALLGGRIGSLHKGRTLGRWLQVAAVAETLLLWSAAACATGFDSATLTPEPMLYAIIALTAVAMGLRNATVRLLKVPDLTTTVLTLTLTGMAADSSAAGGRNPNWPRRLGAVLAIFLGALLGALLVLHVGLPAPLILAGALVLVGTIGFARHPDAREKVAV
ncbi:DUF1275 domain-containing protein [Ancylobacter sp. 6x-1]|uniref:DUF1275 domain-containing protein n=1 Tax=Ancylobacter crimeensis TaxID=2579147 RepID=A0ABT0D6X3_9HYPH|nr:YoaK family protein [Ancylobacter crimeensis]MCK0195702.1 DUF1275 domain-containing protein [Ancylobacter crimeensis]